MSIKPVTLITGASCGIGAELARIFAANGHELALVARSAAQLDALADSIAAAAKKRPHVFDIDLAQPNAGAQLAERLAAHELEPEIVVNNAGFGLVGSAYELDRLEQIAMIDLNVRTLTDLSLRWTESLIRRRGGILNVASVAGFMPGPGMAVYYATKAFVVSFSQALHHEFKPKGVRVAVLCPGPVPTQFQGRAGLRENWISRRFEQTAEQVAQAAFAGLAAGQRLIAPGLANRILVTFSGVMPVPLLLRFGDARKRQGPRHHATPPRDSAAE